MRHLFARSAVRLLIVLIVAAATFAIACSLDPPSLLGADPESRPEDIAFFENEVRPLLVEHCYECHSSRAEKPRANLRLDSRAGLLRGGERGPAIVPGDPGRSLLVEVVRWEDPDLRMPPRRKLPVEAVRTLERWVEMGAPDPRIEIESPEGDPKSVAAAEALPSADHWVWKPPAWPELPAVDDAAWPRTEIDRFILAKLESAGLSPSPEVDRRVWLRRVTFALAGLPPTPDELAAFLEDDSRDAYERVVDRLLASPTFGETWGSHWLDLVRFAETHGHEQDFPIPEAWRYRDYVIRALNADVPYDALLTEHVAGDLIAEPRIDPRLRTNESAQGTGFWHLGEATHSPVDIRGEEADRMASSLDVFGRAFQGLAFGCVRCHDHKFDPIPQDDYYALYGFLQSSSRFLANVADPERNDALLRDVETLRAQEEPRIVEAFVALWKERTQGFADDVLRALKVATATPASVDADDRAEAWRRELERAKGDLAHPLWIVARLASDPARADKGLRAALDRLEEEEGRTKAVLANRVVERTLEDGERNYVTSTRPASLEDVVVDFDAPGPTDWHAGDRAFGDGPRKAGEVRLGQAPESPIVSVLDHGEATVEPRAAFSGFLRTRTFEVTSNTLWYRYRGEAEVFLAVDSHRVVAGPLHGVVRQHLADTKGKVRWIAHPVRDYIGHRVHVEFTPKSRDFALLEVRFSKDKPGDAFKVNRRVFDALVRLDGLASPATIETAARAVEAAFRGALDDLATGALVRASADEARDAARLVDWLIARPELFAETPPTEELSNVLRERMARFLEAKAAIERQIPPPIRALTLLDGNGEDEPVHIRGNARTRGEVIARRYLTAIRYSDDLDLAPLTGSGRLALARRLTSLENPLTLRVWVNRVWHWLFGRGLVRSVDDFGRMGDPPTHPELLDWLALDFARNGWSTKRLIREIVLSSTYRQSSRPRPEAEAIDARNVLWHRMEVRRISAEAIRDSLLAFSGRLELRLGGPSVPVHITPFMRGTRSPPGGPIDGDGRRSIYIEVRRNHLSHLLVAFDRPVPSATFGRRNVSSSPAQPLVLLNDPFVHDASRRWAARLLREVALDDAAAMDRRIERLWLEAFSREPKEHEREAARAFVEESRANGASRDDAWAELCHAVINGKELIYLE